MSREAGIDLPPTVSRPAWLWPRAAYIHVPFCAHHCNYCDFAVASGQDHLIDLYVEAVDVEMSRLEQPQSVDTIFLGGGTPTHLDAQQLERLLRNVRRWLLLDDHGEFSVEANPPSLTSDKIDVLADYGVNRVSLGAQSFAPDLLQVLERNHSPDDVIRAVDRCRRRIDDISLDLIFAVPGQTVDLWQSDLEQALRLDVVHLSTYGLTFEKGTRLWKQRRRGELQQLDEDVELEMYIAAIDLLESSGWEHYEISNFARPGHRCRHNEVYWANEAYFGFGLGAARYVNGSRELNRRDLPGYIRNALAGASTTLQAERLSPLERARETIAIQLRRADGVERQSFRTQTGYDLDDLAGGRMQEHVERELLVDDGSRVRLTRRGKCVADALVESFL